MQNREQNVKPATWRGERRIEQVASLEVTWGSKQSGVCTMPASPGRNPVTGHLLCCHSEHPHALSLSIKNSRENSHCFPHNRIYSAFTDLQWLNGHHMHLPNSKIISSGPEKVRDRSGQFAGNRVDWQEKGFGVRQARVQFQLQHLAGWPRATYSMFLSLWLHL